MKPAGLCGLMMLYLVVLLRPALPSLIYYARQDYFAAELCMFRDQPKSCCKGSCQLARMAHASHGNANENFLWQLQSEELIFVLPLDQATAFLASPDDFHYDLPGHARLSSGNENDIWHPPKS